MPIDEWADVRRKQRGQRALATGEYERVERTSKCQKKRIRKKKRLDKHRCFWFGKHKGIPFESVPSDYLQWALKEIKGLSLPTRQQIESVLGKRRNNGQPKKRSVLSKRSVCHNQKRFYPSLDQEYRGIVGATSVVLPDPGGAPF